MGIREYYKKKLEVISTIKNNSPAPVSFLFHPAVNPKIVDMNSLISLIGI